MPPADSDDHQPPPITPPVNQGYRQNPDSRGLSSSSSSSNRGSMYQREHEFWNAPDGVQTPSDTRGKGASSQSPAQAPDEDWHPLPQRDAPTGHWEYDFFRIPYSNTPEGPAFIRQPMEDERQWVGVSSPPRDVALVVEPPTQRSEDLWSTPPEWRNIFSGMSPMSSRLERHQRQCQASEQIILPEPPTEGPPSVRKTGHAR